MLRKNTPEYTLKISASNSTPLPFILKSISAFEMCRSSALYLLLSLTHQPAHCSKILPILFILYFFLQKQGLHTINFCNTLSLSPYALNIHSLRLSKLYHTSLFIYVTPVQYIFLYGPLQSSFLPLRSTHKYRYKF